jgi:hypothetical protein
MRTFVKDRSTILRQIFAARVWPSGSVVFPVVKWSVPSALCQVRYHLVRFIRSDGRLNTFREQHRLPSEAIYEYVVVSIDVVSEQLRV